jgi:hypothetical protein
MNQQNLHKNIDIPFFNRENVLTCNGGAFSDETATMKRQNRLRYVLTWTALTILAVAWVAKTAVKVWILSSFPEGWIAAYKPWWPLWLVWFVALMLTIWLSYACDHCKNCGRKLKGNNATKCPQCGHHIS